MHKSSYDHMQALVNEYLDENKVLNIYDIGSVNVNGTYKPLFEKKQWNYFGIDLEKGPNVDIVLDSPYEYRSAKPIQTYL